MATIKDVATRAGVSLATASRALSGKGSASPDTVVAVRRAAHEIGYEVNLAARSLRTQRTQTLGLLVTDVRNPFFSQLAYVVEQEAATAGMSVITMNADEQPDRQASALRTLAKQRVDGLIVVPQGGRGSLIPRGLPVVYVDRRVDGHRAPVVQSDNALGSRQMIKHLVSRGHRDIALITGPQSTSTGRERRTACLDALRRLGCTLTPDWVVEGDFQEDSGRVAMKAILDAPRMPTAVFTGDNLMATGALAALQHAGLRIGDDIALVTFDDARWFSLVDPGITAVAQDIDALGREAVRCLLSLLDQEPVEDVLVPTHLAVRASCTAASVINQEVP